MIFPDRWRYSVTKIQRFPGGAGGVVFFIQNLSFLLRAESFSWPLFGGEVSSRHCTEWTSWKWRFHSLEATVSAVAFCFYVGAFRNPTYPFRKPENPLIWLIRWLIDCFFGTDILSDPARIDSMERGRVKCIGNNHGVQVEGSAGFFIPNMLCTNCGWLF